jgi:hypothetical protein
MKTLTQTSPMTLQNDAALLHPLPGLLAPRGRPPGL